MVVVLIKIFSIIFKILEIDYREENRLKKNLTELVFILDRSGSMHNLVNDTIGGFNSMIENQKKEPGEAYVTTVLFYDQYKLLHDHINLKDIQPITDREYYTRGMTALLDAIGKTINNIGSRLNETPEDERPDKVIFVITTDGYENSSREFTKSHVKEMIKHQQEKYSWTFMFLGANMDAVSEASNLGINADFARTYTANEVGTESVYTSISNTIGVMRGVDFDVKCKNSISYTTAMDTLDQVK